MTAAAPAGRGRGRGFEPGLVHRAAQLYYQAEHSQAEVAQELAVSRPTVSRLLAEARRSGIVQITVHPPDRAAEPRVADQLQSTLGLDRVWLAEHPDGLPPLVAAAMQEHPLRPDEVVLVSSGRTLYQLSGSRLPRLPGVQLVPAVGGATEPEAWHQTNEITRRFAERVGGRPHFLFAQAMPSTAMRASLVDDPDFTATTGLWDRARLALVGVGAPLPTRDSVSAFIPVGDAGLRGSVGDICLNFFTADGTEVDLPGGERMVRVSPDQLRRIPATVAVATGAAKVPSLVGGARAGLYNRLVTDARTARLLLRQLSPDRPGGPPRPAREWRGQAGLTPVDDD